MERIGVGQERALASPFAAASWKPWAERSSPAIGKTEEARSSRSSCRPPAMACACRSPTLEALGNGGSMEIANLIAPDGVVAGLRAKDKRQVLEELSRRAAAALGLDSATILAALVA